MKLSRGKFLGGCSGCNGTLCIRGSKQDYDDWCIKGWSGDEFFKYMEKVRLRFMQLDCLTRIAVSGSRTNPSIKAETFHGKPWFEASEESHGYQGPLHVEPHDPAPISDLILKSMISKGLPLDHDMFSHGRTPQGCGHVPRSVHRGIRTTGADFLAKQRGCSNVQILVETHVDKVILEKTAQGDFQATGVRVVKADGTPALLKVRKEVIVSGGAYCSPNILNRSGLGAKDEIEKYGITTFVDLPGVGKNLMDHLVGSVNVHFRVCRYILR